MQDVPTISLHCLGPNYNIFYKQNRKQFLWLGVGNKPPLPSDNCAKTWYARTADDEVVHDDFI